MITIPHIKPYEDARGNQILYEGKPIEKGIAITFRGSNNTLSISPRAHLTHLSIVFYCDNGWCQLGDCAFKGALHIGEKCRVEIGNHVTCTAPCYLSTAEHASVHIGDDCMFASQNEIRADDAHPIFDVSTGYRVNMPRSIKIGSHVWIGQRALLMGGTDIGSGSVIGACSLVKGKLPNNCIAAGIPARVVKQHVAWERHHLNLTPPFIKPSIMGLRKSPYWAFTQMPPVTPSG